MGSVETYRVLILGDFHYGESYTRAGAVALKEHGYSHSTEGLRPFIDASDTFILNLETPLIDPGDKDSPLAGKKTYLHWADPEATGNALKDLGVDAVSLANNHTLDQGPEGLESTFQTLSELGIEWFGAGHTLTEAQEPYRVVIPERAGGGEIHLHGSFQYSAKHDTEYGFYARQDTPGCAPLKTAQVPSPRDDATTADSFQVAFPHWGANYAWRSPGQYRLTHRFLNKDYDLVLGHGGHSLQEVHRKQRRWVVYGLGNGVFNSGGRWRSYEEMNGILPFSFWAMLEVNLDAWRRWVTLKLYPVYSDNSVTNFQPFPVSETDFFRIIKKLQTLPVREWRFNNSAQATGKDDLGHFISLDLGAWPIGSRPSRLEGSVDGGDPGDWPLRSPGAEIEDKVLGLNRFLGTVIPVIGAERQGASAHWIAPRIAVIEKEGQRLLAQSYKVLESSVGAAIVKDKVLAAELLESQGVATPKSYSVRTSEDAVRAAAEIGGQVVVKPRDGRKSRGVTTGLAGDYEVREAFSRAQQHGREVLVQQHIDVDEELRVIATEHEAVAVNGRVLPHVVGDGNSTIEQLINDKNLQRALNPSLVNRPIPIDTLTLRQLERIGSSLEAIPDLGEIVTVRDVAGLSVGGDTKQVLESSSSAIKEAAKAALAAIPGLGWGGVDLIIERDTGNPYVIEINTEASYGAALFPAYGVPKDLAGAVWAIRDQGTNRDTVDPPKLPRRKRRPTPLLAKTGIHATEKVAFDHLFHESLKKQGFVTEWKSQRVLRVTGGAEVDSWVTRGGLTSADRSAVSSVLKNHWNVRKLLRMGEIPTPRAKTISNAKQLRTFVDGRVGEVVMAPNSTAWNDSRTQVLTESEVLGVKALRSKKRVQARSRGLRVRVLTSREGAWVLTANSGQRKLSRPEFSAASTLAVEAIRAIPELRWAAVDVLVRPRRIKSREFGGVQVEGITRQPTYSPADYVIAGNFDDFCKIVIEGKQV